MRKSPVQPSRTLLGSLTLCLLAACSGVEGHGTPEFDPEAISVATVDFDGLQAALDAGRGEGLLLNFWAIWCGPCVAEMPELVEVAREYRAQGGRVVGVSYDLMLPGTEVDETRDKVLAFLNDRELDLAVLIFDDDDYEAINEHYSLPGEIPVTLAIDKDGKVVDRQEGPADKARFDEMMRKALGAR